MSLLPVAMVAIMTFHAFIMIFDEFYFHHKRGLPKWERIGHPMDTLFFLICLLIPCTFSYHKNSVLLFVFLSILSSLIIVKDEKVHLKLCNSKEQVLHALLFITHPLILLCVFLWWKFQDQFIFAKQILHTQFFVVLLFLTYQIVYWNFLKKEKNAPQN